MGCPRAGWTTTTTTNNNNNNSSRAPSHAGRSVGLEPLSFQISLLVFLARGLRTLWRIQKALVPICMGATSLVDPAAAVPEVWENFSSDTSFFKTFYFSFDTFFAQKTFSLVLILFFTQKPFLTFYLRKQLVEVSALPTFSSSLQHLLPPCSSWTRQLID